MKFMIKSKFSWCLTVYVLCITLKCLRILLKCIILKYNIKIYATILL